MARATAAALSMPLPETPSPKPDNSRERINNPETMSGGPRNQQAAIVGAQIEGSIGRAAAIRSNAFTHRPFAIRLAIGKRRSRRAPSLRERSRIGSRPPVSRPRGPSESLFRRAETWFPSNGCGMLFIKSGAVYQRPTGGATPRCHPERVPYNRAGSGHAPSILVAAVRVGYLSTITPPQPAGIPMNIHDDSEYLGGREICGRAAGTAQGRPQAGPGPGTLYRRRHPAEPRPAP